MSLVISTRGKKGPLLPPNPLTVKILRERWKLISSMSLCDKMPLSATLWRSCASNHRAGSSSGKAMSFPKAESCSTTSLPTPPSANSFVFLSSSSSTASLSLVQVTQYFSKWEVSTHEWVWHSCKALKSVFTLKWEERGVKPVCSHSRALSRINIKPARYNDAINIITEMGAGEMNPCVRPCHILCLRRTCVWFPAPMSGSSQLSAIPAPRNLTPLVSMETYTHMCIPTHRHTCTYTMKLLLKINISEIYLAHDSRWVFQN